MPRYQLTIAYDGTHFCGWQKQEPYADAHWLETSRFAERDADKMPVRPELHAHPDAPAMIVEQLPMRDGEDRPRVAIRTVQHVVEQAVRRILREPITLDGASRTDAGVHARGQCGAFTCTDGTTSPEGIEEGISGALTHTGWPVSRGAERLVRAINAKLPPDVLVTDARIVADTFNPISDATNKAYSYCVHSSQTRPLFDRDFVYWLYDALDVPAMQLAAKHFVGTHDFVSFAALHHGRATTVRTVFACEVRETEEPQGNHADHHHAHDKRARDNRTQARHRVSIHIEGSGFLYNMVRIIAGTLVEVGKGRILPEAIPSILDAKDRRKAGPTLPAQGLCLEWIRYSKESGTGSSTPAMPPAIP